MDFSTAGTTDLGADTSNHLVIYDIVRQNITRTVTHFFNSLEYGCHPVPRVPVYNAEFGMMVLCPAVITLIKAQTVGRQTGQCVLSNKYFIRTDKPNKHHALGKQAGDPSKCLIQIPIDTLSRIEYFQC